MPNGPPLRVDQKFGHNLSIHLEDHDHRGTVPATPTTHSTHGIGVAHYVTAGREVNQFGPLFPDHGQTTPGTSGRCRSHRSTVGESKETTHRVGSTRDLPHQT